MVNSHAKGVELSLTARIPNTQVRPRSGRRTNEPMKTDLDVVYKFIVVNMDVMYLYYVQ